MERRGAASGAAEAVAGAVEARLAALLDVPQRPDHVDRLGQRVYALAGGEKAAAHGRDPLPERARAEPELGAAAAQAVERRDRPCDDGRVAERQVQHVRRDPYAGRTRGDERQERPRVEEPRLVRVILERDEVESRVVGERRERDDVAGVRRGRRHEHAELERVTVVAHADERRDAGAAEAAGLS